MKKRIVGMILAVVMLMLSLVSCAYSFDDDNMSKYASLSEADKKAFEQALLSVIIENGDFEIDETIRTNKVMDYVYSEMATKGTGYESTGKAGANDKVYYYYYMTAQTADGDVEIGLDNMSSTSNLIIGLSDYDDDVKKAISEGFKNYTFARLYAKATSGKTYEGDKVYVSYTRSYVVSEDGVESTKTEKVTNRLVTVAAKPGDVVTSLESYLCEKDINNSITAVEIAEPGIVGNAKYSDIKINWAARTTSGKTAEGDRALVTADRVYMEGETEKTDEYEKIINIAAKPAEGASASSVESYVCDKEIGAILEKLDLVEDGKNVSYKNVKVNWIVSDLDKPSFEFTDTTYTEKQTFTDIYGNSVEVKDTPIKYHIFADHYVPTPEFTAKNLIELYYAEDISSEVLYALVLGNEWAGLDAEDDAAKIEERANLIKEFKASNGDDLDAVAANILKYYENIEEFEEAKTSASTAVSDCEKTLSEAESALGKNTDPNKTAELTDAVNKAKTALDKAKADRDSANEKYTNEEKVKENYINEFLDSSKDNEKFSAKITANFKKRVYTFLQDQYNDEIKMNLAKEVYYLLTKNIVMSGNLPEKAVKMSYESMIENYETDFYTGTISSSSSSSTSSSTSQSNYSYYKNFDNFLIAKVTADHKTVSTVKEAKEVLMQEAREYVEPIVKIYLVAEVFGLEMTDKEFKEYKNNPDNNYDNKVYNAGENSVKHAFQLDKILNYFLESEEREVGVDANGNKIVDFVYKKLTFTHDGVPASEADKKD